MPTSPDHSHAVHADAVADAVCLRRVLNAFLTTVATWSLYGVVLHRHVATEAPGWWCVIPIATTALTTAFATWAVLFGDRIVWRRAFRQAAREARK